MAPGFVSAFGRKLKCVADFEGKYCGLLSQLLDSWPTGVASYFGPSDTGLSHIVCGSLDVDNDLQYVFLWLKFGLDNDVRNELNGGGGVGDLHDGVTKTCSESGDGADGAQSWYL